MGDKSPKTKAIVRTPRTWLVGLTRPGVEGAYWEVRMSAASVGVCDRELTLYSCSEDVVLTVVPGCWVYCYEVQP